jgi:hypothetical protein
MKDITRGLRSRLDRLEKKSPPPPERPPDWIDFDALHRGDVDYPDLCGRSPITDIAAERIAALGLKEPPTQETQHE